MEIKWEQELHDYADKMDERGNTEAALLALVLAGALIIERWENGEPLYRRVKGEVN